MEYEIYNPHCTRWRECKERLNTCMGCLNYKKGSMILFNKIFDENLKGLIKDLNKLSDNDWLSIRKYNSMVLTEFVNGYSDFEDNICAYGIGSDCKYSDDDCKYDDELDCLNHYLEYYIKNNCRIRK